jgi:hypothetical protein
MVSVLPRGGDFGRVDMSNHPVSKRPLSMAVTSVLLCAALAGCSVHWPWRHRAPPPPQPVHELSVQPPGAAIQQFWDRNTLLIDLTALSGEGTATLTAPAGRGWPVRLEFRVQPGNIARLEVQGLERVLFEVPTQGPAMLFKLAPGAYLHDTPQITVRWSAADDSAR